MEVGLRYGKFKDSLSSKRSVSKTKPNYKKQTNKQTENGGEGRNQHVVLDYDSHAVAADK